MRQSELCAQTMMISDVNNCVLVAAVGLVNLLDDDPYFDGYTITPEIHEGFQALKESVNLREKIVTAEAEITEMLNRLFPKETNIR